MLQLLLLLLLLMSGAQPLMEKSAVLAHPSDVHSLVSVHNRHTYPMQNCPVIPLPPIPLPCRVADGDICVAGHHIYAPLPLFAFVCMQSLMEKAVVLGIGVNKQTASDALSGAARPPAGLPALPALPACPACAACLPCLVHLIQHYKKPPPQLATTACGGSGMRLCSVLTAVKLNPVLCRLYRRPDCAVRRHPGGQRAAGHGAGVPADDTRYCCWRYR